MAKTPSVLLIAAMDTKQESADYLRDVITANGAEVILMDSGIRGQVGSQVCISREEVAQASGSTLEAIANLGHEGQSIEAMTAGVVKLTKELHAEGRINGVISIGGSMGSSVATAAMRELPIGFPKLMISTMASGFTRPFVGSSDITMLHSIADIAGINSVLCKVLNSGGAAIAGMAKASAPKLEKERPLVVMSNLGITERCSQIIRDLLDKNGFEVTIFHANGAGGLNMEEVIRDGGVACVVELALIEILDHLGGGLFDAGPERGRAIADSGVPAVVATGCIDVYAAGPLEQAKQQFPGRRYHQHNAAITAVRTSEEDLSQLAERLADLYKSPKASLKVMVPLGGFSSHDSEEGNLYEPELPPLFAEKLKQVLDDQIAVDALPYHINDEEFAEAVATAVIEAVSQSRGS